MYNLQYYTSKNSSCIQSIRYKKFYITYKNLNYHKIWIIIINKYIVPYQQQRKIEKHWLYRYNLIDFIHDLPERRSLEDMITRAVFTQSLYTLTRGQRSRDDDREVTIENRLKGTMEKHSALHRHSSRLFVNGYDRTHFYRHGTWSLRWVDSVANLSHSM